MDKQEIYRMLRERGIAFELTEHAAVYNMAEIAAVPLPYPDRDAKNLFVRDDKKRSYYLVTVLGDKRVDLKELARQGSTRRLSFASEDDLLALLGLTPGAVTPLGLLNDTECRVTLLLDKALLEGSALVGVHPNDNTATVWLQTGDLIDLLRAHGSPVQLVEI